MKGLSYRQLVIEVEKRRNKFINNANKRLQELLPGAQFLNDTVVLHGVTLQRVVDGRFIGHCNLRSMIYTIREMIEMLCNDDYDIKTFYLLAKNWESIRRIYYEEYTSKIEK